MTTPQVAARYCPRCQKAKVACLCSSIRAVTNAHEVLILQHASEAKHPLGSARILQLALQQVCLIVADDFAQQPLLQQQLSRRDIRWCLLYPSDEAQHLTGELAANSELPLGLVVLDGTWKKAHKIWCQNPQLQRLPAVKLANLPPSRYQIRKSAKSAGLSTLEAVYYALAQLEPTNTQLAALWPPFEQMINFQLAHMPLEVRQRY